jgi:hypothetical protein
MKIGSGGRTMKVQRLLFAIAVINFGLLLFLLAQTRIHIGSYGVRVWTNFDRSVLSGRGLEIVDSRGRIRASINSSPEAAVFQLIDQTGRPSAEFETSERGGGLRLGGDAEGTYVQLSGHGLEVTKDGQSQMIP